MVDGERLEAARNDLHRAATRSPPRWTLQICMAIYIYIYLGVIEVSEMTANDDSCISS